MTTIARLTRTAAVLAALTAATASLTGIATASTAPSSSSPPGTAATSGTKPTGGDNGTARIVLGDLDPRVDAASVAAPFDPCKVGWDAFPAEVRPQPAITPRLRAPKDGDIFATACRYDNSATAELKPGEKAGLGATFLTMIAWARPTDGMSANPADHPNARAETFNGKAGLLKPGTNRSTNEPQCTAIVSLADGVAGISITNGRFSTIDTCQIAKTVGDAVAAATP
ncbi:MULTISPECIES: hypothetical protein [Saccharothrix]|uniref:hypothetical protein n=1 Tax=Saccharothrix TaxID=2071 RepID=UPI00093B875A|nr:hypothetical protein [Saccharothrix sp. CB00851]OKI35305.1 hypothetical protein A6A25_24510 [Saccharothrix sp. CB00851]